MAMNTLIRRLGDDEIEELVRLSLLAWAPVFSSFEQVLGSEIYLRIYPDWRAQQAEVVEKICKDCKNTVYVAEADGAIAGFIVYDLNIDDKVGEVQLLAVHPEHQNGGIGTELNNFVLAKMQESGMKLAVVGTGGDPGH